MIPANIRLFSADLEGTLLGRPEGTCRFTLAWQSIPPTRRPLLVFNTSRTVSDTRLLAAARGLPEPDYIIGGVGTELYSALYRLPKDFSSQFGEGWDPARVEEIVSSFPGAKRQPAEFLHRFKSSWFWERARTEELEQLKRKLREAGIRAHVDYSCRYFLDVVPACAGKGKALKWLCERLSIPLSNVLVAGDAGNDTSMFLLPHVRGVVVDNALPELRGRIEPRTVFVASSCMADGVIEGLQHFGVLKRTGRSDGGR